MRLVNCEIQWCWSLRAGPNCERLCCLRPHAFSRAMKLLYRSADDGKKARSVGNVEYVTNDRAEFKKINFSNLSGNLSIPDHSLSQSCSKYVKSLIEFIIKKLSSCEKDVFSISDNCPLQKLNGGNLVEKQNCLIRKIILIKIAILTTFIQLSFHI